MKIGIVIPIYNQAAYLTRCLESLVAQTDGRFVACCVNDGSTDDSQDVIDAFVARDQRFVSIQKVNGGLSSARNAGLDLICSQGGVDAVMFLDSDDLVHPQCVEFVLKAAQAHPGDVIEFKFSTGREPEAFLARRYDGDLASAEPCKSTGTVWNKLYPLAVIDTLRFGEEVRYSEDIVFTTELELKVAPTYRLLPYELYYYTDNPDSMSRRAFAAEDFRRRVITIEYLVHAFENFPLGLRRLTRGPLPSLLKRYYRDLIHRTQPDHFVDSRRIFACELRSLIDRRLLKTNRGCLKDFKYYVIFRWLARIYGRGLGLNVVRVWGGLGNQMFQYAFGQALSKATGMPTTYDLSWFARHPNRAYGLEAFRCEVKTFDGNKARWLSRDSGLLKLLGFGPILTRVKETPENRYNPEMLKKRSAYVKGYFQVAQYYADIRTGLLSDFRLKDTPLAIRPLEMLIRGSDSVSLHVRRGDYLNLADTYSLCGIDYYDRAVNYVRRWVSAARFFVFSDDLDWCRSSLRLPENTVFVDTQIPSHPELDLYLMSLCKHNIIANSSFSWWGAWLNESPEKIVIAPKSWFVNSETDIIPHEWVCM